MENININGTSFHDGYVLASCNELKEKLQDEPVYIYKTEDPNFDKTHIEFHYQLEDGTPFSIYDWKQFLYDADNLDEILYYHIGTHTREDTIKVLKFLESKKLLTKYDPNRFEKLYRFCS